jgi:hypothetical protein
MGYTEHCMVNRAMRPMRPPASLVTLLDRAPRADEELVRMFPRD